MKFLKFFQKSPSPLLSLFAALCFAGSATALAAEIIDDYNADVRSEQFDRQMIADHGATFSHDAWGLDIRKPYRRMILVLSFFGFLLTLGHRTILASVVAYLLALPMLYDWIIRTMRDLSYNTSYMADSPYWLRLATVYDWLLFGLIGVVIAIYLVVACRR